MIKEHTKRYENSRQFDSNPTLAPTHSWFMYMYKIMESSNDFTSETT